MITCVQTFASRWIPTARARLVLSVVVMVLSAYVAIGASGDFISHFVDIVLALLLVLVPWTAINLIDFYLIHRGHYDLDSIFASDGGIYGRFNNKAIAGLRARHPRPDPLHEHPAVRRSGGRLARTART